MFQMGGNTLKTALQVNHWETNESDPLIHIKHPYCMAQIPCGNQTRQSTILFLRCAMLPCSGNWRP